MCEGGDLCFLRCDGLVCAARVLNGHLGGRQVLLAKKSEKYLERVYHCRIFAAWDLLDVLYRVRCVTTTISSSWASRSLSFSSRSSFSLLANQRRSRSNLSTNSSFFLSFVSGSNFEVRAAKSCLSSIAWEIDEVKTWARCRRLTVDGCGSGRL